LCKCMSESKYWIYFSFSCGQDLKQISAMFFKGRNSKLLGIYMYSILLKQSKLPKKFPIWGIFFPKQNWVFIAKQLWNRSFKISDSMIYTVSIVDTLICHRTTIVTMCFISFEWIHWTSLSTQLQFKDPSHL